MRAGARSVPRLPNRPSSVPGPILGERFTSRRISSTADRGFRFKVADNQLCKSFDANHLVLVGELGKLTPACPSSRCNELACNRKRFLRRSTLFSNFVALLAKLIPPSEVRRRVNSSCRVDHFMSRSASRSPSPGGSRSAGASGFSAGWERWHRVDSRMFSHMLDIEGSDCEAWNRLRDDR